ncbi:hypothetical protein [Pseudomonas aeruginosa]|uniref:hypothetical protein n=1 Tax=Pseudomonas aeruginosa TaxID=287 RepID=UPI000F538BEA|nr:hypothetical protein [Pseudomonas aeruginosa]EIU1442298.1 hypothetical protein [Pseudomonas aeruginosa]EIU2824119.1 hypothetical protein [Pseudomonas aeruginosa]EIW4157045.1 hypothetical protein [Pseudomonas aeruginosa]EJQ7925615.1 hypothetical protein [Pseudomonas aeruginosa]EKN9552103.1 hypothetical protein [Pseudomonas aeruginosa]
MKVSEVIELLRKDLELKGDREFFLEDADTGWRLRVNQENFYSFDERIELSVGYSSALRD